MCDHPDAADLRNRRVTIMGLGRFGGGTAVAQFLSRQGARITITDLRTESELKDSLELLQDCAIEAIFGGGHPDAAFRDCELLIVNPGVRPDDQQVKACQRRGVTVSSEIELFLQGNPAFTIAVTGSNGKSTSCQLIHDILAANSPATQRLWLGGNIGQSLLPQLSEIRADDRVILEISSFQLHQLRHARFRPNVAVVTSLTPNHLDWHPTLDHYVESKQVVSAHQSPADGLVLPDQLQAWPHRSRCLRFGLHDTGEDGVFYEPGELILRQGDKEDSLRLSLPPALRGEHNRSNVAAAVAACRLTVPGDLRLEAAVKDFTALPHRMQLVASGRGRFFVDDSAATTPESLIAALKSATRPCVLIAGGQDKGADLTDAAAEIAQRTRALVAIGPTARKLSDMVSRARPVGQTPSVVAAADFSTAFRRAVELTCPGDMVLLSPGFSSFGWFADFRDRGHQFSVLAQHWCEQEVSDS